MINFSQFLLEAFDKPFPYREANKNNSTQSIYIFNVDNNTEYQVGIGKRYEYSNLIFPITFSFYKKVGNDDPFNLSKRNKDQFRILATVKQIIFDYFDRNTLNYGETIKFDTYNDSTANLYTKFAKELARRTNSKLHIMKHRGGTDFELIK